MQLYSLTRTATPSYVTRLFIFKTTTSETNKNTSLFPGIYPRIRVGAGKGTGICLSHDHQTPIEILGKALSCKRC